MTSAFRRAIGGRTGRSGFVMAVGALVGLQILIEPLVRGLTAFGAMITIPYIALLLLAVSRRGRDLGVSGAAAVTVFAASLWAAEAWVQLFPAMSSVRMVPLLTLMLLPGRTGAKPYGSSRTVQ